MTEKELQSMINRQIVKALRRIVLQDENIIKFLDNQGFTSTTKGDIISKWEDQPRDEKGRFAEKNGNSNMRQEGTDLSVPKEYAGNFEDFQELTLSQQDREILGNLQNSMLSDGFEHGAVVIDGETHYFTSGFRDKIEIPPELNKLIESAPEKSVKLYHTHPSSAPHSAVDFRQLLRSGVDKSYVIGYNGDVFSVRVGDGWIPTIHELDRMAETIRREVDIDNINLPGFDEWTLGERNYVATREQAYRIARHFKWTIEGGVL